MWHVVFGCIVCHLAVGAFGIHRSLQEWNQHVNKLGNAKPGKTVVLNQVQPYLTWMTTGAPQEAVVGHGIHKDGIGPKACEIAALENIMD